MTDYLDPYMVFFAYYYASFGFCIYCHNRKLKFKTMGWVYRIIAIFCLPSFIIWKWVKWVLSGYIRMLVADKG